MKNFQENNKNLSDIINELIELKVNSRCSEFGERIGKDLDDIDKRISQQQKKIPGLLATEVRSYFTLSRIFGTIAFFLFSVIGATWVIATVITSSTLEISQHKKDIALNTTRIADHDKILKTAIITRTDYEETKKQLLTHLANLELYKNKVDKEYALEMQRMVNQIEILMRHINKEN